MLVLETFKYNIQHIGTSDLSNDAKLEVEQLLQRSLASDFKNDAIKIIWKEKSLNVELTVKLEKPDFYTGQVDPSRLSISDRARMRIYDSDVVRIRSYYAEKVRSILSLTCIGGNNINSNVSEEIVYANF